MFKTKNITSNIFYLQFDTRKELGMIFVRFQEHYENPKFHDKIFGLTEFKTWYKKYKKSNKFTYCEDWSGFNIPSYILKPFYEKKFKNISKLEKLLLDKFRKKFYSNDKFYIIASAKSTSKFVYDHEVVHANFYINDEYRKEVLEELEKHDLKPLYKVLWEQMYNKNTWDDEINAYLTTGYLFLSDKVDMTPYIDLVKKLKKILKKHYA